MTEVAFGQHVARCVEKKSGTFRSVYSGTKGGNMYILDDKDKAKLVQTIAEGHLTRSCLTEEAICSHVREAVNRKRRDLGLEPKPSSWSPSRAWLVKFYLELGITIVTAQRDNIARQLNLGAPRNLISNAVAFLTATSANFTHDGKKVHSKLKLNVDALTIYTTSKGKNSAAILKEPPFGMLDEKQIEGRPNPPYPFPCKQSALPSLHPTSISLSLS